MDSACNLSRFVFYGAVSAIYWYAWMFDTNLYREGKYVKAGWPHDDSFGGRAKFLTYWTMAMLTFYFTYSAVLSLIQFTGSISSTCKSDCNSSTNSCFFKKLQDFLYYGAIFPFGIAVVFNFWSNYYIDRKLVYPIILDSIIPAWFNHVMHTLPLALLIENYLTRHIFPSSFWRGAYPSMLFGLVYMAWLNYIRFSHGKWVYGIMDALETPVREVYQSFVVVTMALFYWLGRFVNNLFWSSETVSTKSKKTN